MDTSRRVKRWIALMLSVLMLTSLSSAAFASDGSEEAEAADAGQFETVTEEQAAEEAEAEAETLVLSESAQEAPAEHTVTKNKGTIVTKSPVAAEEEEEEASCDAEESGEAEKAVETEEVGEAETPVEAEETVEAEIPGEAETPVEAEETVEAEIPGEAEAPVETEAADEAEQTGEESKVVIENKYDHLDIILDGIAAEDAQEMLEDIKNELTYIIDEQGALRLKFQNVTDAEKYWAKGYDMNLCWAASGANMLWDAGWAQIATNPATGKYFQNVDEVFDYFRHVFTDVGCLQDGAITVFMDGSYAYAGSIDSAQIKDDAPQLGLLKDMEYWLGEAKLGAHPEYMQYLEDLANYSFGLALYSMNTLTNEYTKLAHAVTAVGLVFDKTTEYVKDRYKAIVLADSDNDAVAGPEDVPDEQKAVEAAKAINSYTVYPLKLHNFGEKYGFKWTIPGYWDGENEVTVIDWAFILENRKVDPDDSDDSDEPKKPAKQEGQKKFQSSGEANMDIKTRETFDQIKAMMIEKDLAIYSEDDWTYERAQAKPFEIYVRASDKALLDVFMDGEAISEYHGDFTVIDCQNGMFAIVFGADYMNNLSEGTHVLTINLARTGEITQEIIVK